MAAGSSRPGVTNKFYCFLSSSKVLSCHPPLLAAPGRAVVTSSSNQYQHYRGLTKTSSFQSWKVQKFPSKGTSEGGRPSTCRDLLVHYNHCDSQLTSSKLLVLDFTWPRTAINYKRHLPCLPHSSAQIQTRSQVKTERERERERERESWSCKSPLQHVVTK